MAHEKTQGQLLEESLSFKFPLIAAEAPERIVAAQTFCEGYKAFLSKAKTEREGIAEAIRQLEAAGYTVFDPKAAYKAGDKVYMSNRGKSLIAATFGTEPAQAGLRLNAAHIDYPRLDLKPNPLYEKDDLAYFKTHYYGGIRKYQWATIPLSLHGVIYKKNGEQVVIDIGEDPEDPVFYITDLLPHLSAKQNERRLPDGIRGEELNILAGSIPYADKKVKSPVKLTILALLNEKYGITEADFFRAELEAVAAGPARDVGLDRSMIMAAGQDDRVCAYPALQAEIGAKAPTHTTVTILTDKEEIGSVGNTGLNSEYLKHFLEYLAENTGADYKAMVRNSLALSSDVNACFDPSFPDVFEKNNACCLGKGPSFNKYTGARGKSSASDASAETMARVIAIMEENGVYWQSGEIGKVDEGGGGTVAQFMARLNLDVVDLGVPVLAMHAPKEIVSKLDVYEAYLAYSAFYK